MSHAAAFEEAWAVHEALRRLGFKAEDIYLQVGGEVSPGAYQICVVLRAQGKEFIAIPLAMEEDPDKIEAMWQEFVSDLVVGKIPESELERIWLKSQARTNAAELVLVLQNKGFVFPGKLN